MMAAAFVVAWSSGFVGATLADEAGAEVWPLLAWRYLVTAALLLLCAVLIPDLRRSLAAVSRREFMHQAVLSVLAHVLFLGGVFLAASQGLDAGLSALVCALQPLLVTAAGRVLFSDQISVWQWVGLVVALAGVVLSVGGITAAGVESVGLVVMSLLGLSTASLLERRWQPQVPVVASLTVQVCVAAVVFVSVSLITGGVGMDVTGSLVMAIGWLVLLSGLGGYATFTWCLRHLGATATSTLLYVTAPVTMLWAWAMFNQEPSVLQWVGLAVVMIGVVVATRSVAQSTERGPGSAPGSRR